MKPHSRSMQAASMYPTLLLSLLLTAFGCQPPADWSAHFDASPFAMPYDLSRPDTCHLLPDALREISGLSWCPDTLWTHNDEQGILFCLSANDASLLDTIHFHKHGDYEGIEKVGATVWVVKSNGTLYAVDLRTRTKRKYATALGEAQDVEGLAYDSAHHRLLLACKGSAGEGFSPFERAIYAFDLDARELQSRPLHLINQQAVDAWLGAQPAGEWRDKLMEAFAKTDDHLRFQPSALAVHPLTGDLWVVSSPGKLLAILSPDGKIRHIARLDKRLLPQPEGIAFAADGTLFLASEGRDGQGKICRFHPLSDR